MSDREKRIGIDASAMLVARKNGYEYYVHALILAIAALPDEDLADLELVFYFHAGNPLAEPALLAGILSRLRRFKCRIYHPKRLFSIALPLLARIDRLDWLHLPVHPWARWYPCPVGVTIHDVCSTRLAQYYGETSLSHHEDVVQRQLKLAAACIAVSASTRQDVNAFYGVPIEQIYVVHHGVDAFFYPSSIDAERVKQKYGLEEFILTVNALQVNKNHERLLSAYAQLRQERHINIPLVLVGRGGIGAERIQEAIKHFEPNSAVRYLDYVPRKDLRGLYSAATLVANPSLCEGFGLPILEAMACGAPVALSSTTSLPEVGGDAALYFDPLDTDSISETLWQGLSSAALREDLRQRGLERAAQFSWERAARATLAAYRSWGQ
ncbi:MAG TPA: glycosyltransferase family 1 protein [Anaerolineae bacterium]|nr:glycosyltransferase family 1 protein [Anaerolineae bacterium]HQI83590.1 glycosyltransferase family 1 protein [Anaerolineae bacterium]